MLHIKNLTAGYGKVNVLHGISLDVNEREVWHLSEQMEQAKALPCAASVVLTKCAPVALNSWGNGWME